MSSTATWWTTNLDAGWCSRCSCAGRYMRPRSESIASGCPDCPVPDKFANGKHNPAFKKMSDNLKAMFQAQGLPPYPFPLRSAGDRHVDVPCPTLWTMTCQHSCSQNVVFSIKSIYIYLCLQTWVMMNGKQKRSPGKQRATSSFRNGRRLQRWGNTSA